MRYALLCVVLLAGCTAPSEPREWTFTVYNDHALRANVTLLGGERDTVVAGETQLKSWCAFALAPLEAKTCSVTERRAPDVALLGRWYDENGELRASRSGHFPLSQSSMKWEARPGGFELVPP